MKEKILDYLHNNHWSSGRDHDIIESFIDDFFDQYQPERSKREDPHLKLEDVKNMTKEEMKQKMKEMEDTILRQYIQMTSCYVCPKCVGCGALNSMET